MRYGDRFCSRCQRNGCVCPPDDGANTTGTCGCTALGWCPAHAVPVYRACLHDVPEDEPCARCDDMALADVPEPKTPALPRRSVLRPEQHEPGFVVVQDDALVRVALVSPQDAATLAVLRVWIEHPDRRGLCRSQAAAWESSQSSHEERAKVAPPGSAERETHETRARESAQWAAGYRALVGLHVESVGPPTPAHEGTK